MKLSHRHKQANKNGVPQRQYAARVARKQRRNQQRLRRFARRQHRLFRQTLNDIVAKALLGAVVSSLCCPARLPMPAVVDIPVGLQRTCLNTAVMCGLWMQRTQPAKSVKVMKERKPTLWQRAKGALCRLLERPKLSENPAL